MWLSSETVERLTRRKQPKAQIRVLVEAGIPFRVVDGRPIVVEDDLKNSHEPEKRVRRL